MLMEFLKPIKQVDTKDGWTEGWNPACDSALIVSPVNPPKETVTINVSTPVPISAEYLQTLTKEQLMIMFTTLATVGNGYWHLENSKRMSRISRETMVSMSRTTLNAIGVSWQSFKPKKTQE